MCFWATLTHMYVHMYNIAEFCTRVYTYVQFFVRVAMISHFEHVLQWHYVALIINSTLT